MLKDLAQIKIALFLKDLKRIVEGNRLHFVDRREHRDSLLKLGITKKGCNEEILSLSVSDYCSGPEKDKDRPGEVWVFGKTIAAKEVYIKLKIYGGKVEKKAKCISFHIAEHPLHYPYKNSA